jgi:hypothetical protein
MQRLFTFLALLGWLGATGPALAATATPAPVASPETAAPVAPAPVTPADVQGFRSARFGMSDDEVRKAIVKDFGVKPDAIKAETNPGEQTRVLTVKVPELLPRGGAALVSYVLGYSKGKLVQVNIVWSKDTDPAIVPDTLARGAGLLVGYFQSQAFSPESLIVNGVAKDRKALVAFRGVDAQKRMVLLILPGTFSETRGDSAPSFSPVSMRLSYILDPDNPDIFKIAPGQF